jgi:hypothetical protein
VSSCLGKVLEELEWCLSCVVLVRGLKTRCSSAEVRYASLGESLVLSLGVIRYIGGV